MHDDSIFCDGTDVHEDAVRMVRGKMPSDEVFARVTGFFKVLGDTTRARIIWALDERELCVCDLASVLGMTKSAVSHQLSILRQAELVTFRREGKNVFYALMDEHVKGMFESGMEHIH